MASRFPHRIWSLLKQTALIVVGLGVLVVTIAWLSGMFEQKIAPNWQERSVAKLTDQPTDVVHEVFKPQIEEAIGTLKASSRTIVASKVLATIETVHVSAGDQVEAEQDLIDLDSKELQARLLQANRLRDAATARRERAESEFDRRETLFQQNAISRSEFDQVLGEKRVALAEEERAKQAVQEAAVQLSYAKIISKRPGRIVDRLAEPGDIAQPGQPLLILYDATSLRLEAPVNESLAVQLKIGQAVEVFIDATDTSLEATIDEIVPQADSPSRSFLVKASIPQSEGLYEGMFGRLRVATETRRHLCMATDAIVDMGQLEFVDVVLENGTIERRLIKLGQQGFEGRREVLSGVEAGETVILQNQPPVPETDPELVNPGTSSPATQQEWIRNQNPSARSEFPERQEVGTKGSDA